MHDEQFQPNPIALEILRASMPHVPFDGWGEAALIAGAADSGHDAAGLIPLFRVAQLMRSRFIRGWQINQWLMRFWRFPSVREKCI